MTEYNAMGLKNYIFDFMKNITPRKDENGWEVLEERYYKNIATDTLVNDVHSKILDKLADKISDKFIEDLLYKEVKKNEIF